MNIAKVRGFDLFPEKLFHEDPEFKTDVPQCYLTYSEAYADALQKCLKIYQKAMVLSDPREIL